MMLTGSAGFAVPHSPEALSRKHPEGTSVPSLGTYR